MCSVYQHLKIREFAASQRFKIKRKGAVILLGCDGVGVVSLSLADNMRKNANNFSSSLLVGDFLYSEMSRWVKYKYD